jgi:hypothetical protein
MHIDGIGVEGRKLVSFSWTSYLKDQRQQSNGLPRIGI